MKPKRANLPQTKVIYTTVPAKLKRILDRLKSAEQPDDFGNILRKECTDGNLALGSLFTNLSKGNMYHFDNHEILTGLKSLIIERYDYPNKLLIINNHKIRSAPTRTEVIALQYQVAIVTEYPEAGKKSLIPYEKVKNSISQKAKQEFYEDMERLAKQNLTHANVLDTDYWYSTDSGNRIFLCNWWELVEITSEKEKAELLQALKEKLSV